MANDLVGDSNSQGCTNSSGQAQFHLRRVGEPASQRGLADVMDFHNVTYTIGSNRNQVDYFIDSSDYVSRRSIFRVVRQADNQHRLLDDNSLNGIFVNNIKITGSCILFEGDMVTFGWALPAGTSQRQPDSEHQFIFERCNCSTGNLRPRPVQTSAEGQCMQSSISIEAFSEATGGVQTPKRESLGLITSSVISSDTHDKVYVQNSLTTRGNEILPTKDKVSAISSDLDDNARDELKDTKGEQNIKRKSNLYQNDSLKKIKTEIKTENETEMEESVSEKCMMTSDTAAVDLLSGCDVLAIETGNNSTPKEMPKTPLPGCSYTQDDTGRTTVKRSSNANNDGKHVDDQKDEAVDVPDENTQSGVDVPDENTQSVESHVKTCRKVIDILRKTFASEESLKDNPRIMAWSQYLKELEKKLQFPKTIIAVVGDTGVGKSSLMNAILNYRNVLPTSGIQACTAVAVEVIENTRNSNFEAEIEFLTKEEWQKELKVLTQDVEAEKKKKKRQQPDKRSDAYISHCKVNAVYGCTGSYETLSSIDSSHIVLKHLGRTEKVSSDNLEEFRCQIRQYIKAQETESGGQYWPIVKHVRLRVPRCDVCRSGAVLVDLPGIKDSNAARDKIASEYLKNCTAVWIVSDINRAIDDNTAKYLLGDSFRRQLLMDGLYGSTAFICTKTDHLEPLEIISDLKLKDKTNPHQDKIAEMRKIKSKLKSELQHSDHGEMSELMQKIMELEKDIGVEQRAIKAICAKARNEYSERKIMRDFKEGLKEIKRYARMNEEKHDDEEEEEEEDLMSDDDEKDEGIESSDGNLKVFCCSSTEYQKLKEVLTEDDPAQVFDNVADTEIPDVCSYVHEITSVRRQQAFERLMRGLEQFVSDIHSYIVERKFKDRLNKTGVRVLIDSLPKKFENCTKSICDDLSEGIDYVFSNIHQKLKEGVKNGEDEALGICEMWGSSTIRYNTPAQRTGGLPWITYNATTRRNGMYKSKTFGQIDFNEDLCEPLLRGLTRVWDEAFSDDSGRLWKILDKTQKQVLDELRLLTGELCCQLEKCEVASQQSREVCDQFMKAADNKLAEMVKDVKEKIKTNQRETTRQVKPKIEDAMKKTYEFCSTVKGSGAFKALKEYMKKELKKKLDKRRKTMYDDAKDTMWKALMEMKKETTEKVDQSCQTVIKDLQIACEPLWDDTATMQKLRAALEEPIKTIHSQVRQLFTDAGLPNREEQFEDLQPGHGEPAVNTGGHSTTAAISP